MTQPLLKPVRWATDDDYTSGPDIGTPTKVEPLTGEKASGHIAETAPSPQKMNWWQGMVGDWIAHLGDVGVLNWRNSFKQLNGSGAALDLSYTRGDNPATSAVFYSSVYMMWFALGMNTNDSMYVSLDGLDWDNFTTGGVLSTHKIAFGCEAFDRLLFFVGFPAFPAASRTYAVSGAADRGTFSAGTLPDSTSGYVPFDAVYIPSLAKTLVVGGDGANGYCSWTSSDNGVTFPGTDPVVFPGGGMVGTGFLWRAIVGKNGRVFAWDNTDTGANGNRLWYTDDAGTTWNHVVLTSGVDRISDGCYDADDDVYYFASKVNQKVYVFEDPTVVGSEVVRNIGVDVTAVQCFGGLALIVAPVTRGSEVVPVILGTRDRFATMRVLHRAGDAGTTLIAVSRFGQFVARANDGLCASLKLSAP